MFQLSKCIPVRHIFTLVQGEEVLPSLVFKAFYICFCIVYSFVLYIMCYIPFIQLQNCPVLALCSFTLFGVFTICVYIYIYYTALTSMLWPVTTLVKSTWLQWQSKQKGIMWPRQLYDVVSLAKESVVRCSFAEDRGKCPRKYSKLFSQQDLPMYNQSPVFWWQFGLEMVRRA